MVFLWIDLGLFVFSTFCPSIRSDGGQIASLPCFGFSRGERAVFTSPPFLDSWEWWGLVCVALWLPGLRNTWSLLIGAYMLMSCWSGFKTARTMILLEKQPRREGFACPSCGEKPHAEALSGNARNAVPTSTHLRLGLFGEPILRGLNFPTRCAASAKTSSHWRVGDRRAPGTTLNKSARRLPIARCAAT